MARQRKRAFVYVQKWDSVMASVLKFDMEVIDAGALGP